MNKLKINKVEDCMNWLMEGEAFSHSQSVNYLIDKLGELTVSLAFVNNQMAISKQVLNEKKVSTYHTLITSETANEYYFSPSLAKDFINAKLSKEQYDFDLCERCSRTIVHTIDSLRTAVSALKMEKEYA